MNNALFDAFLAIVTLTSLKKMLKNSKKIRNQQQQQQLRLNMKQSTVTQR